MSTHRIQTWLAVIVVGGGVLLAAAAGMYVYVTNTPPLYPSAADVASVADAPAPPEWSEAVARARQVARAGVAAQNLPGLSVAVGIGGRIVWAEGFGLADLDNRVPVSPRTRFRIGTASVALTSAAVGLLLEQERLKLDERIQTYVPAYPDKPWPITLRQVMGHVAGVRNDAGDEGPYGEHCEQTLEGLRIFADQSLLFEPGTAFRYSSYGWILVSAAVEAAAGEPFLRFMRRQIFEPLGMDGTRAESATESIPDRATFYFPRFAAEPRYGPDVNRPIDLSCYAGASVFLSTPSDLVRFGMAVNGGTLLKPSTVELLQTPQQLRSGETTGYGLGWDVETATVSGKAARIVGHDGDMMGGMAASLLTLPEHGLVVSVISNISYAGTYDLALKIAEAFAEGK